MSMFSNGFKFALVTSATAALMACGGGSSTPARVASTDTTLTVGPSTGVAATAAVSGKTFSFPNGSLGGTTAATVTLTSGVGGANSTFELKSGADTVTGDYTYGSCIFTIKTTSNATLYPVGKVVTYNPCSFVVSTAGATADGVATSRNVTFDLGRGGKSSGPIFPVTVNPDGSILVGGLNFGVSATLVAGTGAGG